MSKTKPKTVNAVLWLGVAGVALFYAPLLDPGKTLFFRDLHRYFFPMKAFLAQCLRRGEIPLWCPHYFCGAPFLSDIQTGVFYPPSLILTVLPFHMRSTVLCCFT